MLDSLHIQNFRCFEDLTIPSLGRVNLIVGKNNVGKSTLLEAMQIFARGCLPPSTDELLKNRNDTNLFFEKSTEEILAGGSSLVIEDRNNDNHKIELKYTKSGKIHLDSVLQRKYAVVETCPHSEDNLSYLWDDVYINSEDTYIKDALHILEKEISSINFIKQDKSTNKRIAFIKLNGQDRGIPLRSMGEGMIRLLQIFLSAFQARNGFLMIDEFENGLHYSIQEEVWEKLFRLATELDIQVFATTHSKDAIESFCKVADADKSIDGKLISLARSAKTSEKGKIFAVTLGEEELMRYVKSGMEVRG